MDVYVYILVYNRVLKELGSGQFGGVHVGTWKCSNETWEVAIKTLNPTITQSEAKVRFLQEAAIMAQFRHPNVIQLYGIVTDGEPVSVCVCIFVCVCVCVHVHACEISVCLCHYRSCL